jgi:hypothetical protein
MAGIVEFATLEKGFGVEARLGLRKEWVGAYCRRVY